MGENDVKMTVKRLSVGKFLVSSLFFQINALQICVSGGTNITVDGMVHHGSAKSLGHL